MFMLLLNDKYTIRINQIVGYVLSGDPAYVPRYNNARNQIRKYERDEESWRIGTTTLKRDKESIYNLWELWDWRRFKKQ